MRSDTREVLRAGANLWPRCSANWHRPGSEVSATESRLRVVFVQSGGAGKAATVRVPRSIYVVGRSVPGASCVGRRTRRATGAGILGRGNWIAAHYEHAPTSRDRGILAAIRTARAILQDEDRRQPAFPISGNEGGMLNVCRKRATRRCLIWDSSGWGPASLPGRSRRRSWFWSWFCRKHRE